MWVVATSIYKGTSFLIENFITSTLFCKFALYLFNSFLRGYIMKKQNFQLFAIGIAAFLASSPAMLADIPIDYYSSLQGLSGAALKTAISKLVGQDESIVVLKYGSGTGSTWSGFYTTDRITATNQVRDRYSNEEFYFGDKGSSVSGMNIEHSFPKSWWGGSSDYNSYKDLFNLMPCESSINQSKSNYPMGKVATVGTSNGCTKVGYGEGVDYKVWEPADNWKGDFARGYLYMATAYQNLTWDETCAPAVECLENNTYPTLQQWAYELYMQWARADEVDDIEIARNNAVNEIQGNRNPFVDFPNLMEYVWGDSTNVAFNVLTTVKSDSSYGTLTDGTPVEVYADTFLDGSTGNCSVEYTVQSDKVKQVWKNQSNYGWVAKCSQTYNSTTYNYASDATLFTPEIDLTNYVAASFSFEHACKFAAAPSECLSVLVREEDGTQTVLHVPSWPAGTNWTYVKSGKVSLTKFAGKKIQLGFRYTSSTDEASTWEIKNLTVTAQGLHSSITSVPVVIGNDDATATPEYYSIDGRRVDAAMYRGVAIRRCGTSVTKQILK
jgi:hypothetical protein